MADATAPSTVPSTVPSREWDAEAYHRISEPQFAWGMKVLAELSLCGSECALDAGCGSGRLTAELRARLPRGTVIAADLSANMARAAADTLGTRFGRPPAVVCADLVRLPFANTFDVVFSTATFHWVLDHPALWRSILGALAPGGRLHAQCGGGPNLARIHARALALMESGELAPYFAAWTDPWRFDDARTAERELRDAGFASVETSLEPAPTRFAGAADFHAFIEKVVLRHHVARLPGDHRRFREHFLHALTEQAAGDDPPYVLDYWRLNLRARRPG
ncbi:MAG: class I SAM-dependent methyltransferase [Gemmatimonadaceae bacterium]